MDATKRRKIERVAEVIRSRFDIAIPVDVFKLVEVLGGRVLSEAPPGKSSAFVRKVDLPHCFFEIGLAANERKRRRRFSVAHEIGHLILHMGYLSSNEKWQSISVYEDNAMLRWGYNEEEHEANEFAAALLMPREAFKASAKKNFDGRCYRLGKIADEFQVSLTAARVRGQWLGIFAW